MIDAELFFAGVSGFPGGCAFAEFYELSGPALPVSAGWPGAAPAGEPVLATVEDLGDLVEGLRLHSGGVDWAVAAIDGGDLVAMPDWASSYIPAGAHLPYNVGLIHPGVAGGGGEPWRLAGLPPAERLVAVARQHGWWERVTAVATSTRACPRCGEDAPDDLGSVPLTYSTMRRAGRPGLDWRRGREKPWGSMFLGGARHRLAVTDPDRYAALAVEVHQAPEAVVGALADATVALARAALPYSTGAGLGSAEGVLSGMATRDPDALAARRLAAMHSPVPVRLSLATASSPVWPAGAASWFDPGAGLPAEIADWQAGDADVAHHEARHQRQVAACALNRARRRAEGEIDGYSPRPVWSASARTRFEAALREAVAADLVTAAVEAALLWSADPLPVADLAYATGAVAAGWLGLPTAA